VTPTTPANSLLLATVSVAANATSILTANITQQANAAMNRPAPKFVANSNVLTGTNPATLLANNSIVPIIQAGTVVCTTDVNGFTNFAWPQAFPNALWTAVITNGDDGATGKNVMLTLGSAASNQTTCYFNAAVSNTGNGYANLPVRCNFIAIGY
jgi:hypothetical protein